MESEGELSPTTNGSYIYMNRIRLWLQQSLSLLQQAVELMNDMSLELLAGSRCAGPRILGPSWENRAYAIL